MILVAGGSGRLGTHLVADLVARGLPVRVLTRDPVRAEHLTKRLQIDVVSGDVRDASSLIPAMAGVTTVVSAVHGFSGTGGVSPASVDRAGNVNLIDAVAGTGASVVLMSVVGASPDSPMELFRMKDAAEQYLQRSGAPWTIVRSTAFLELWLDLLRQTAGRSGRPLVFGRGENPINFVSVRDVAALAAHVVAAPATRGSILEIGGPENLTFNELASRVGRTMSATGGPRHVPRPALRAMATLAAPFKPELSRMARSALVLDSAPFTFDASAMAEQLPGQRLTTIDEVLGAVPLSS